MIEVKRKGKAMQKWMVTGLALVAVVSCSHKKVKTKKAPALEPVIDRNICQASREFITTLEYLREHKEYQLTEKQARDLADKVSLGCSDASRRFIQTTELLLKAEMDARKAFDYALRLAQSTNEAHEVFQRIFKEAFVQELLDLDATAALETASTLSLTFKGSYQNLSADFNYLVRFCVDQKSLGLPIRDCAGFATRIAKMGGEINAPIAQTFQSGFDYLTQPSKANLPTVDALKTVEKILPYGSQGLENFKQAFDYATKEQGLALPIRDAIEFSLNLTQRTKDKE
jgi:hypothetical protein